MHLGISGDDRRVLHPRCLTAPISHDTARFPHEQDAGRDIPGRKRQLPECVEATAGDVSEIERSIIGRADVPFIKKPFHAESLYSAVREAMKRRPA